MFAGRSVTLNMYSTYYVHIAFSSTQSNATLVFVPEVHGEYSVCTSIIFLEKKAIICYYYWSVRSHTIIEYHTPKRYGICSMRLVKCRKMEATNNNMTELRTMNRCVLEYSNLKHKLAE